MSTHKYIDKICWCIVAMTLVVTLLFMNAEKLGVQASETTMGYETRLFDDSTVHTIDIIMDDWDSFISTCENEEYSVCTVLIDNEAYKNVGIRAKGNTSLSNVSSLGSERYSFKIEFDHYDSTTSYYGLDKLSLNNIIQDDTYIKDYLVYKMMNDFGVASPLVSFVYITVNGEDWGLYLAVEGVEESFLTRNYGSNYGELYKPDSTSGGGGGGAMDNGNDPGNGGNAPGNMGGGNSGFENGTAENISLTTVQETADTMGETPPDMAEGQGGMGNMGGGFGNEASDNTDSSTPAEQETIEESASETTHSRGGGGGMNDGGGMTMGSSDTLLSYSDDDYDSYSNIFDNAKTDITDEDKDRLIAALKTLSEGEDIESAVDVEAVIRYFVVHNFVCNFDSYTGSMIHNYYLYEEDGILSMIPWDYNLAFGGFNSSSSATSLVNYPIDTPVSGGTVDQRPMLAWIFNSEEYTEMYHEYFAEFIEQYFDSGYFEELIDQVEELISPYVEKDPTKFCTYEEFQTGIATLKEFCLLRAESVKGQLDGTIPSTSDGQSADSSNLIDASDINISDMGSMNTGGGHSRSQSSSSSSSSGTTDEAQTESEPQNRTENQPQNNEASFMSLIEVTFGEIELTDTTEVIDAEAVALEGGEMPSDMGGGGGGRGAGGGMNGAEGDMTFDEGQTMEMLSEGGMAPEGDSEMPSVVPSDMGGGQEGGMTFDESQPSENQAEGETPSEGESQSPSDIQDESGEAENSTVPSENSEAPGQNESSHRPGSTSDTTSQDSSQSAQIIFIVSIAVLLFGLFIAFLYKR
ncbi:MAG: CotH kinase family protein [Clostridiales bacterium]|nr:CotH kinase family protein [Clostridiales bacterium]